MKIPLALFPVGGKLHSKDRSNWPQGARRRGVYHVIDKRLSTESGLCTGIDACQLMQIDYLTRAPPRPFESYPVKWRNSER